MGIVIILLLASTVPHEQGVVRDSVDLVELNHFYDDQGRHVFDQAIYYDWDNGHARYMVRAWRLVKVPGQVPIKNWGRDTYVCLWWDNDVLREVSAKFYRETWTQYDPELVEREYLAKEKRVDLTQVKSQKKKEESWLPLVPRPPVWP